MTVIPIVMIVTGLPGSGKTTFFERELSGKYPDCCFDDFHANSIDGTGIFSRSKYYETLKERLRDGRSCVISDIEYCRSHRLMQAQKGIETLSRELGKEIRIGWLSFENNPNACRHNIVHRYGLKQNRNYLDELAKVDELSQVYECPALETIPVKTCCDKAHSR